MSTPRYPSLYQINTRLWLTELSEKVGRRATLDDIPDAELDSMESLGFDWVWFLSVWQTGRAAQIISRTNPEWRKEFRETLPDLREDDIGGSGFAITDYSVHVDLGGTAALGRLRERLRKRGLKLMLDFVPNHMALDHPWVDSHRDYFVPGTEIDLARAPQNYTRVKNKSGSHLLAHGRDPYFPGWPDTLQLNYANPATQDAMIGELTRIARQCDGVRCDMAMLVLPEVFERTWGLKTSSFWPRAIDTVRKVAPDFTFMAEVYWDLEWTMQQQGFNYAYDKRLYDRLRHGPAKTVREHLFAGIDYQGKLARFLENHDEPRAAATFNVAVHKAASIITFLTPGLRFFHQGQFAGKRKRISPHLVRGPQEPVDTEIAKHYDRLLHVLRRPALRFGDWKLLECRPAWEGNGTADNFIAFLWKGTGGELMLVAVNYAASRGQCYVRLPMQELAHHSWRLADQLNNLVYDRAGDELLSKGLYLDVPGWQYHAFTIQSSDAVHAGNPVKQ